MNTCACKTKESVFPGIACLLVACLLAAPATAQIYRCQGEDETVTFSDHPCSENASVVDEESLESSGISSPDSGPASSISLADGSILPFRQIITIEVRTRQGFRTGRNGLHVPYGDTDQLVDFKDLVSLTIISWDRDPCGNTGHLCRPMVRIRTTGTEFTTRYEALRNIRLLVEDELDGQLKDRTLWFGNDNQRNIRSIRF